MGGYVYFLKNESTGLSEKELDEFERGENPDGRTLAKILRFLLEDK